jgi:hypothetical protein
LNTGYFSCDCPSDQKLADYIDDYYYQILYPCVRADERLSSDNRTKFDFVVAVDCRAFDRWNGKAVSGSGLLEELTMFKYKDASGRKDGARYL